MGAIEGERFPDWSGSNLGAREGWAPDSGPAVAQDPEKLQWSPETELQLVGNFSTPYEVTVTLALYIAGDGLNESTARAAQALREAESWWSAELRLADGRLPREDSRFDYFIEKVVRRLDGTDELAPGELNPPRPTDTRLLSLSGAATKIRIRRSAQADRRIEAEEFVLLLNPVDPMLFSPSLSRSAETWASSGRTRNFRRSQVFVPVEFSEDPETTRPAPVRIDLVSDLVYQPVFPPTPWEFSRSPWEQTWSAPPTSPTAQQANVAPQTTPRPVAEDSRPSLKSTSLSKSGTDAAGKPQSRDTVADGTEPWPSRFNFPHAPGPESRVRSHGASLVPTQTEAPRPPDSAPGEPLSDVHRVSTKKTDPTKK